MVPCDYEDRYSWYAAAHILTVSWNPFVTCTQVDYKVLQLLSSFQYFNKLRETIISSQPADKQQAMAACFENLMDGIERSLLTKNRDRLVFKFKDVKKASSIL